MIQPIFEAKGLTKQYGDSFALQDIHMTIGVGEIYGFVGENGAGKTTLMKIIGGLVHATEGSISLFGKKETKELRDARRKVGFLIERPALYPNLNAVQNLMFYCQVLGFRIRAELRKYYTPFLCQMSATRIPQHIRLG